MKKFEITKVRSIKAMHDPEQLMLDISFTVDGVADVSSTHVYSANDPYGLNAVLHQWFADNPGFPVQAYVPPPPLTDEERRAAMPRLSPYQFRMGLLNAGMLAQIEPAIEAMPEPNKSEARIAWEYATFFERTNKFIAMLAPALGLTDEQVDGLWASASQL